MNNIEVIKGVFLYAIDDRHYVLKSQALDSIGLPEISYNTVVNHQVKAGRWLNSRGFVGVELKLVNPLQQGNQYREVLSLESWLLLLEYFSVVRQNEQAIKTLNTFSKSFFKLKLEVAPKITV